jgi:hypothetical protein
MGQWGMGMNTKGLTNVEGISEEDLTKQMKYKKRGKRGKKRKNEMRKN